MKLTRKNLEIIAAMANVEIPKEEIFSLPEKVLQFGTGVLLRALPDYFINKANKAGIFNGRIVVVKSTSGDTAAFNDQDNLYTICVKGVEEEKTIEEFIINSSISRVLSAREEWKEILKCAHNPELTLIISNTTEVGIVASDDDIHTDTAPPSFPGKLLAFLLERFKAFNGANEKGLVIIPTELIIDNGEKLKLIVLELAEKNILDADFIKWISISNHFCNSLVDRIVPGKLPADQKEKAGKVLGYQDELMIMAEPFRLWAIESGNRKVIDTLSFSQVDNGVVIAPAIEKFRELKLRLLNGTHTFTCGLAYLAGFNIVREAMKDEQIVAYIKRLMMQEIAPAMTVGVATDNEAAAFGMSVLDRFKNPFIDHQWLSITLNYSSKMRSRNVSLLINHYKKNDSMPRDMSIGFAAFLAFMKCGQATDNKYYGQRNGQSYLVNDPQAPIYSLAAKEGNEAYVMKVLSNYELWGADLSLLKGFHDVVLNMLNQIETGGMLRTLNDSVSVKDFFIK